MFWQRHVRLTGACLLCHARSGQLDRICDACRGDLPYNSHACGHCALPLPAGTSGLCGKCLTGRRRPPRIRSVFRYAFPVDRLIHRFKYQSHLAAGALLAELMAAELDTLLAHPGPDVILPIPLHPLRLRERGFNQAAELARPLARTLGARMEPALLSRQRATREQRGLSAKERRRNLRGAFAALKHVNGRRVLIIDDVVTTANTAVEAARVVRRAGATDVQVLSCARAE
ncbi:MAG: ComF family protein [Gammaproteobacteria bacterium]|jgi:ComF family protein